MYMYECGTNLMGFFVIYTVIDEYGHQVTPVLPDFLVH